MKFFAAVAGVIGLIIVAVQLLIVATVVYVAWEILFDNALNRWFG